EPPFGTRSGSGTRYRFDKSVGGADLAWVPGVRAYSRSVEVPTRPDTIGRISSEISEPGLEIRYPERSTALLLLPLVGVSALVAAAASAARSRAWRRKSLA